MVLVVGWGSARQFSLVIFLVTFGALCEYFFMAFPHHPRERTLGIGLGVLMAIGMLVPKLSDSGVWPAGIVLAAFSVYLFLGEDLAERYRHLGWALLGTLYAISLEAL
jgi:hypothetical protein